MAFDIIDRKPKIDIDDKNSIRVSINTLIGNIEFKNVSFEYPTRKG